MVEPLVHPVEAAVHSGETAFHPVESLFYLIKSRVDGGEAFAHALAERADAVEDRLYRRPRGCVFVNLFTSAKG